MIVAMSEVADLQAMDEGQVRQMLASMLTQISARDATIRFKQALIDKLTYENAALKHLKFGLKSERMNAEQRSLLDETLDTDLAAVERKSGFALLAKVPNKSADLVGRAIEAKLKPLSSRVKTLTVDNGKEFADHQAIDQTLGIQTYFADPYCSWQRGSNENFNGLLRQYIPKKRRMETVTDEELNMIENRLNHRPRKRLGFKTPHEVFHASLNRVAVRT